MSRKLNVLQLSLHSNITTFHTTAKITRKAICCLTSCCGTRSMVSGNCEISVTICLELKRKTPNRLHDVTVTSRFWRLLPINYSILLSVLCHCFANGTALKSHYKNLRILQWVWSPLMYKLLNFGITEGKYLYHSDLHGFWNIPKIILFLRGVVNRYNVHWFLLTQLPESCFCNL